MTKGGRLYSSDGRIYSEHPRPLKNGRILSRRYYASGKMESEFVSDHMEILEIRVYSEAGALLIDARKGIALDQCTVQLNKRMYRPGEKMKFSAVCHCPESRGCLAPRVRDFWRSIKLRTREGRNFSVISSPMADISDEFFYDPWFKDGSEVMWFSWPDHWDEFHFVALCEGCASGERFCWKPSLLDHDKALPPGNYSASLVPPFDGKPFFFVIGGAR